MAEPMLMPSSLGTRPSPGQGAAFAAAGAVGAVVALRRVLFRLLVDRFERFVRYRVRDEVSDLGPDIERAVAKMVDRRLDPVGAGTGGARS